MLSEVNQVVVSEDKIEKQYTDFPYPEPIDDMLGMLKRGYRQGSFPNDIWPKLFPEKDYTADLTVLIAGCGTNQAIAHALAFPNSEHYAIDVSEKSLKHVAKQIKKYGIKNLEIEKTDICDVQAKDQFDYVASTGVIHHTEDPQASLSKLVEATKEDGALFIMVYGSYLRLGLYYLQDAFRYLNLAPNQESIKAAKQLIELLPDYHYAHNYINAAKKSLGTKDLTFDAGFVDTFFNARDVAFDIFGLKQLIENAGAYFQCWGDNSYFYRPLYNFPADSPLLKAYDSLDPWQVADFTQKMAPNSGKFAFSLRKKPSHQNIFFDSSEVNFDTYVSPILASLEKPDYSENIGGVIGNSLLKRKITIRERIVWDSLNSDVGEILAQSNAAAISHGVEEEFAFESLCEFLHDYWRRGFVNFAKTPWDRSL